MCHSSFSLFWSKDFKARNIFLNLHDEFRLKTLLKGGALSFQRHFKEMRDWQTRQ